MNNKIQPPVITLSNLITCSRILLAPVFLFSVVYFDKIPFDNITSIIIIWAVFIIIEITDFFDGFTARLLKQESEIGRILDPFADSVARLTYFLAFAICDIMPLWILVVVLYRDLWIGFVRILFARKGIIQGARISGKIKAWIYAFAGISGLISFSLKKILINSEIYDIVFSMTQIVFYIAVLAAVWTVFDYTVNLIKKS